MDSNCACCFSGNLSCGDLLIKQKPKLNNPQQQGKKYWDDQSKFDGGRAFFPLRCMLHVCPWDL